MSRMRTSGTAGPFRARSAVPPRSSGANVRQKSSSRPSATSWPSSGLPRTGSGAGPARSARQGHAAGRPDPRPPRPRRPRSASSARWSGGDCSVVSTSVDSPAPEKSGPSGSRSSRRLTTAIAGVGRWPRASRSAAYSCRGSSGRYFSARAVPAPTRITSAKARSIAKTCLSAGDESVPDRPFQPWAAPSRLVTMLARTQRTPTGYS